MSASTLAEAKRKKAEAQLKRAAKPVVLAVAGVALLTAVGLFLYRRS